MKLVTCYEEIKLICENYLKLMGKDYNKALN